MLDAANPWGYGTPTPPMATTHRVRVPGFGSDGPSLAAVRALVEWLAEGIDRSLRLRVEGRSTAQGPRPRWSMASHAVSVRSLEHGSIELDLSTPSLGELFQSNPFWSQQNLFLVRPDPAQTPLDLFAESVRDAVRGHDDADTLDAPLLSHIASVSTLLDAGAESIILGFGGENFSEVHLERAQLPQIVAMSARAPETRRVRIAGELDTLSISTGAFILLVDGAPLRGMMARMKPSEARDLLGTRVLTEGELVYRPSGRPLRLDAAWMRPATDADRDLWSSLPSTGRPRRQASPPPEGWAAIFQGLEPEDDDATKSEAPEA